MATTINFLSINEHVQKHETDTEIQRMLGTGVKQAV